MHCTSYHSQQMVTTSSTVITGFIIITLAMEPKGHNRSELKTESPSCPPVSSFLINGKVTFLSAGSWKHSNFAEHNEQPARTGVGSQRKKAKLPLRNPVCSFTSSHPHSLLPHLSLCRHSPPHYKQFGGGGLWGGANNFLCRNSDCTYALLCRKWNCMAGRIPSSFHPLMRETVCRKMKLNCKLCWPQQQVPFGQTQRGLLNC